MNQNQLTNQYNESYELYEKFVKPWPSPSEELAWHKMKQTILKYYLQEISKRKNSSVLDFGCGVGTDAFMLTLKTPPEKKVDFTGIDISAKSIAKANRIAGEFRFNNCLFQCANVETINLNETFDLIISSETLEHVIDTSKFLKNLKRHLKPDGMVILSTPNDGNYLRRVMGWLPSRFVNKLRKENYWQYKKSGFKHYIEVDVSIKTVAELKVLLVNHGFLIEESRRGTLVYGGEWLDRRPLLAALVALADALIPSTWLGFGWNTVYKLKPMDFK